MKTLQFNSSLSLTPYFVVWTHPFASVFEKLKYPFTSSFFFFLLLNIFLNIYSGSEEKPIHFLPHPLLFARWKSPLFPIWIKKLEGLKARVILSQHKLDLTTWSCCWCYSVSWSCPTLCSSPDPMDSSMPGFPVFHHFPELAQTHVYWVGDGDAIQPSHTLSSPSPPTFNLSQHQGLF